MLVAELTHSQPLFRGHEIRLIEQAAAMQPPAPALMERAGKAAAELATCLLGNGYSVLVLAGPGNNGGDALVAARFLRVQGYRVTVVLSGDPADCHWMPQRRFRPGATVAVKFSPPFLQTDTGIL